MLSFVQLDKPHIASDFWLIVFLFYKFIMHLFKQCKINRAFQISDGRIVFLFLFVDISYSFSSLIGISCKEKGDHSDHPLILKFSTIWQELS
mgnify:CR=1 FL=1